MVTIRNPVKHMEAPGSVFCSSQFPCSLESFCLEEGISGGRSSSRFEDFGEHPTVRENLGSALFAPLFVPITASGLQG